MMNDQQQTRTDVSVPGVAYPIGIVASGDEIGLSELLDVISHKKLVIFLTTLIFLVGAVYMAIEADEIYRAEITVAPVDSASSGGNLQSLASSLGGLPGFGGLKDLAGGGATDSAKATAVLKSRAFLNEFIDDLNLKPQLFPDQWSEKRQEWIPLKEPQGMAKLIKSLRAALLPPKPEAILRDPSGKPSDWDAYKAFSEILFVEKQTDTGLTVVAIEWTDPVQAAEWANLLIQRINEHVKKEKARRAKESIEFLEDELKTTKLVGLQQTLYGLIEKQIHVIMLSEVQSEFAFSVLDPAVVPKERIRPQRAKMVMIGGVLGVLAGVFLAFLLFFFSASGHKKEASVSAVVD